MALIAMCSAKGSPGVTVTALACALSWTRPVILAECDPAGGDITAGYLREVPVGERGLAHLTASLHRRRLSEDLWSQLVDLAPDKGSAMTRLVLPGLTDPAQAAGLASGWPQIADLFHSLDSSPPGYDVVADCGRLAATHAPTPVLAAADVVLLMLRLTLPSIRASAVAVARLRRDGVERVALVPIGDGPYSPADVASQLHAPIVAVLPDDPGTATVLSTGGNHHRGRLLRAAARAEPAVRRLIPAADVRSVGHVVPSVIRAPGPDREARSVR